MHFRSKFASLDEGSGCLSAEWGRFVSTTIMRAMSRTGTLSRGDVSIGVAAERVGVGVSTIRRWRREGLLPFVIRRTIVGGCVFSRDEIEALREFVTRRHAPINSK